MGSAYQPDQKLDVICQNTRDGEIIPIKIRLCDEDGMFQTYVIKGYKSLADNGDFTMPNSIVSTSTIFPFECKINTFGQDRNIRIYYNSKDKIWRLVNKNRI
ncbi:MAG: hypothetical protein K6F99_09700 [Lachnospiraceae bacterium]|nr:hypothetical protein [Lachnospiraceae bacterium]